MNKKTKADSNYSYQYTMHLKDEDIKTLNTRINDSKSDLKSIRVKIEATHSGIVNGNRKLYLPIGMKNGIDSFTKPYNKPVTVNHDSYASPLGRVVDAKYVSYGIGGAVDSLRPVGAVDIKSIAKIQKFISTDAYKAAGYKGLGHVELIAEISDKEAIQKIADRRYLTVSIGGGSNSMYCSICGVDNKKEYCNHYPGNVYDGQECFFVTGDKMYFDHVSYVNSPADLNTNTELLDSADCKITILDYVTVEKGSKKMKLTEHLKAKFPTYSEVKDYMVGAGLAKHVNEASASAAKELDFILSDEKILPIFDKAHAIAARLIVADAEIEDADKDAVLAVIDEKLAALIGKDFSINDELDALKAVEDNPVAVVEDKSKDNLTISDESINNIVSKVVDEIKKSFNVSDTYAASRLKSLQKVNDSLEAEVQSLSDKLKTNTVNQILTLEDKLSDNDYKTKLELRNITSLEDKLADILDKNKSTRTEPETVTQQLNPNSVDKTNVSDTVVEDTTAVVDTNTTTTTNDNEKLSNSEIIDEYKKLIREKGLSGAKKYIQDLRDANKIPDTFTF